MTCKKNEAAKTSASFLFLLLVGAGGCGGASPHQQGWASGERPSASGPMYQAAEPTAEKRNTGLLVDAPEFELSATNGESYRLSSFQHKTSVVLEWFDPSCAAVASAHETGSLRGRSSQHETVTWLLIDSRPRAKGRAQQLNDAAGKWKISRPILFDGDGKVAELFGVEASPTIVVINIDGKIAYRGAPDNSATSPKEGFVSYVADAIKAVDEDGELPTVRETESQGCRFGK